VRPSLRQAVLAVGLALLLSAAPARAAEGSPSHPFLFTLEGFFVGHTPFPPPEGEFEDACGAAVDSVGDVYLSDYYHHTINIYGASPEHPYFTQYIDPDPDGPCNLAVDAEGNLYVNHWHRNVVELTPSEFPPTPTTTYQQSATIDSNRSTGLTIDPATGRIYVDDRTYVAVYEPSGEPVLHEGEPLQIGLDPNASYYGVAVSDFPTTAGEVYLADAVSRTIKVFDSAGGAASPAQVIAGPGTPQHGFVSLVDSNVAIDPTDGHLFVADNTEPGFEHPAAVVDEFNPAGEYRGQLPHALVDAEPSALVTSASGEVLVTSGNDELAVLYGFGPTEPAHRLAVTKSGTGEGVVTSEPAGIDCGAACAAEYNVGEELILTAVPDPGSAFAGWSGCNAATGQRCTVTMGADKTVIAEFEDVPAPASTQALAQIGAAALPSAEGTVSSTTVTVRKTSSRHRHHRAHHTKAKGKGRR